MSELTFQSPLELIFKNGTWKSLSIDPDELELRRALLPVFEDESIENWDFTSPQSLKAYELLSKFFRTGDYDRFLLYCPTQIVPHVSYYRTCSPIIDDFIEAYLATFHRLCSVYDVQANFIDGDVPDIELSERHMPEVVQVAYLIPDLMGKELISKHNLVPYLTDPAFLRAIRDVTSDREPETFDYEIDYSDFPSSIIKCFVHNSDMDGDFSVSVKRAEWLRKVRDEKTVKQLAKIVDLSKIKNYKNISLINSVIAATIDHNVITLGQDNVVIRRWLKYLMKFIHDDFMYSLLRRLHDFGFVFDEPFNFRIPKLEGDYDKEIAIREKSNFKITDSLLQHIFPAVILYGSKLKGYGFPSSDTDVAVFMLPGATAESAKTVDKIFGFKVLKFFTEYDSIVHRLFIKNGDSHDPAIGCTTDSHILFNGLWVGEDDVITHLVDNLLCEDNKLSTRNYYSRSGKKRHLAEIEKDLLQYRLLHKGYERFRVVDPNVDRTYFDVGYRALASRLYLGKVFNITIKVD